MDRSIDDATKRIKAHRDDGEEVIKKTSNVVPIDGGAKKDESVENEEKSSAVFNEFLEGIKDKNVSNRKGHAARVG